MRKDCETTRNQAGGSKHVPTPTKVGDSNNDGMEVQLIEEQIFGIDSEMKMIIYKIKETRKTS